MATNEILPFALSETANVVSQAAYAVDTKRLSGFSPGVAESAKLNKVWRQSSFIAAGVAAWLASKGIDVLDNGDLAGLVSNLSSALVAANDLAAPPGSGLVGFHQAEAGAIGRDVEEKLREFVSCEDYPTLQAALDTGKDVIVNTATVLSDPVTMATSGQRLRTANGAVIKPNFDGDVIRVTATRCAVDVKISGGQYGGPYTQPRVGAVGAAIVIGYGGANAQGCSVAGSFVENFYGDIVRWENGSMLDLTSLYGYNATRDGVRCTSTYDDNNHGLFSNTHIVSCAGVGYNVLSTGAVDDVNNSRSHVFVNAKGFGCGKNYFIGTINNIGSVFSELGTAADEFGPYSRGNNISVIETDAAFQSWVDNGGGNVLQGYSSYDQWEFRKLIANMVDINSRYEGRWQNSQTGARTFLDSLSSTTGDVTITHSKGTASKRTDIFSDRLQFPGSGAPMLMNFTQMGEITPIVGALAAGGKAFYTIPAATSQAGPLDSCIVTLGFGATSGQIQCTANIEQSGDITIMLKNEAATSVTLGQVTLRWVVIKHYA